MASMMFQGSRHRSENAIRVRPVAGAGVCPWLALSRGLEGVLPPDACIFLGALDRCPRSESVDLGWPLGDLVVCAYMETDPGGTYVRCKLIPHVPAADGRVRRAARDKK